MSFPAGGSGRNGDIVTCLERVEGVGLVTEQIMRVRAGKFRAEHLRCRDGVRGFRREFDGFDVFRVWSEADSRERVDDGLGVNVGSSGRVGRCVVVTHC